MYPGMWRDLWNVLERHDNNVRVNERVKGTIAREIKSMKIDDEAGTRVTDHLGVGPSLCVACTSPILVKLLFLQKLFFLRMNDFL